MNKIRPKRIVEGFTKALTKPNQQFSEQRITTCNQCEFNKAKFCSLCGCFTPAKVKVKEEFCPENKWKDIMIVKTLGVAVTNLSEDVIDLTHVQGTSTVDLKFKNVLKKNSANVFKVRVVNARGNYFDNEVMTNMSHTVSCGSCTKILNKKDLPKVLADGESYDIEVEFKPTTSGRTSKKITLNFNKNQNLFITFKANVE